MLRRSGRPSGTGKLSAAAYLRTVPTARFIARLIACSASPAACRDDADRWGVERRITILFADLRGFTALAERLYPYDAVFLLNRYFEVMGQAIERHGGAVDKFLGD